MSFSAPPVTPACHAARRLLAALLACVLLAGAASPTVTSAQSSLCQPFDQRPTLSGPELTRETVNFVIHYTEVGRDGATRSFVDEVERTVEEVYAIQINQLGYPLPPPDCGEGGDQRFDIYLLELYSDEGTLGFAQPEGLLGDNPVTALTESYAAYSYLAIDNDYAGLPGRIALMRSTIAHEFHHAIQFGYDLNDAERWFYEATSVWIETRTFPAEQDATPYAYDLFLTPDHCPSSEPDDDQSRLRIYSLWTLLDSLVQDHGVDVVEQLWTLLAIQEGMPAWYTLLSRLKTTPAEVTARWGARNLLRSYALGAEIDERVRVEANVNGVGTVVPRRDGVQPLGVDYLLITQPGVYTFTIDDPTLALYVVGVDQAADLGYLYALDQSAAVDTTPYSRAYVLIVNTETYTDPRACRFRAWSLTVADGAHATPLAAPDDPFDAQYFSPAG